ncbi:MAG: NAD(P)-binding domain-containing protein, partial [Candidatus Dormibacteria bacterium]
GSRARSLSDLAIDVLAGQGRITDSTSALVIGAGTMGSIAATRLHALGARVSVLSRTRSSQDRLAHAIGGTPVSWETVPETCSVIIAATSDADYILTPERLGNMLPSLDHDLLIVDLAMPRDVDPLCALLPHVEVIDIDTIANAGTNSVLTKDDLDTAQALLAAEVAHTIHIHQARSVAGPTIQQLTGWAEERRTEAVQRGLKAYDDPTLRAHVDALTKRIVKQLLHPVLQRLHDDADDPEIAHFIHELFPQSRPSEESEQE